MDDITDDELEHRMREKLLGGSTTGSKPVLSDAETKITAKLMGQKNAQRLASGRNDRPFKYRPPVVAVEYYEVPDGGCYSETGGWVIEVFEDGVRRNSKRGLTYEQCRGIIRLLAKRGIPITKIETEWMKHQNHLRHAEKFNKPASQKFIIIDQLKYIKL